MNQKRSCLVKDAFDLLGVQSFFDLSTAYTREDQKLMKSREWDPYDPDLITNRLRSILEHINPDDLDESDRMWRNEILWFWYHHAVSCEKRRDWAQYYAGKALEFQGNDHPNRITRLLWLLAHDKVDEAKKWVAEMPDDDVAKVERQTGLDTICEYEKQKFWN